MLKAMLVVVPPLLIASAAALAQPAATPPRLDLKKASIVVDKAEALHLKAAEYLQVEVARRCGVRLAVSAKAPGAVTVPLLYMDTADHALPGAAEPPQALTLPEQPEAYSLWSIDDQRVHLRGSDARGLLFGAGKLVQVLTLSPDEIYLETPLALLAAPKYPIRAHQLGYRNTANTYDMWDVETFDQYIRDLIAFGTNGIELIPALEEGQQDSPVMKENMWDMTLALCDTISGYGIDVWMWSSADEDLSKPEEYAQALARRKHLFESCKRIDAFFVPGGDDGDNLAQYLMPWMKDVAKALKEAQPHATLWVSNQTFTEEENDYLFNLLQNEKPDWLKGVIYGPWTEMTLAELRDRTPEQYFVRRYPDITHLVRCQYPVDDWDPAFAHLLNREAICPRPRAIAHIHNLYAPHASGFGTYSDGVHDDLNKFVWSALGWNPEEPIERIVQAYADLFFGDAQAEAGAAALFALEENWVGPILDNHRISQTLEQWKALWNARDTAQDPNWRLQMYLMRAYYDAYVQEKAQKERAQEATANEELARATEVGPKAAIAAARATLADTTLSPKAQEYRKEIEGLAAALLKSIGFQFSIKPPYRARNAERGALLDTLDQPLNNRLWLETQFVAILELPSEAEQEARVLQLATWEQPGEGSFYDDLGNLTKQPHVVRQKTWAEDPGGVGSAMVEFQMAMKSDTLELSTQRLSWLDQAKTLYGTPLLMRYEGLDPSATYRLRVTYAGRYNATMTLTADGTHQIHGPLPQPNPVAPQEFEIPAAATADGVLDLSWELVKGRGCQLAEVWLLKKE